MENASRPTRKAAPLFFKIFSKANWGGVECFRVDVTYSNGEIRHVPAEFKDEAGALRYMHRFHRDLSREQ
jgi:hypothetical protein